LGCYSLSHLVVASGNTTFDSRSNCNAIIETASNTLIAGCKNTVIPGSVTAIGGGAFAQCSCPSSVIIPNSVTSIGAAAFYKSYKLMCVTMPNSVTLIGPQAFYGCDGLTSVTIPNSVTTIGEYAFAYCSGLTRVTIPTSVTSIGDYAFRECSSLPSITIPSSITTIGNGMFAFCCSLTSVTIPASVTTIGSNAFYGCSSLPDVMIPNSVTSIGEGAFSHCTALPSVAIPSSVTTISREMFSYCSALTSVTIPASVTAIGNNAFYGCSSLPNVTIPNSVTSIAHRAFYGCSSLSGVAIPASVTAIGGEAFNYCSGMKSMEVDSANPKYDSRDDCNAIIETGRNMLIAGCQNTKIPTSVISIKEYAFLGCSSLVSMTIPSSVTTIGGYAFRECSGLTSVTIPPSVTSIGNGAFAFCTSLADVYCYIIDPSSTALGNYAFFLMPFPPSTYPDYSGRKLHVRQGSGRAYRTDENWNQYFEFIVEDLLRGDVNRDGEVNIADVNAVVDILLGGNGDATAADVNADDEINIADINMIIAIILGENYGPNRDYVDLGLPSGTLWAACNVGASRPEGYGDYFAWGETTPKTAYDWSTYKWCGGSKNTLTKYCTDSIYGTVDGKTELDLDDDAAWVNWGPEWRMPTQEQIDELIHKCTWTMAQRNGVNGQLVTGPNGNKIFLPAAGYRDGNSLVGANLYCHYWTGTIYSMWPSVAYYLYCYMNEVTENGVSRFVGHPVRPVRAPQN
jgi:hypothetical protein